MVVQRVANPGFFDSIGRCFPRALSSKVQQAAKTGSLFLWVFITLWHALRPPPPPGQGGSCCSPPYNFLYDANAFLLKPFSVMHWKKLGEGGEDLSLRI